MSDERLLLGEIDRDLQLSGGSRVLYLEGKSDPEIYFAALGVARPLDGVHEGVLVRGLQGDGPGSGNEAVRARVRVAGEKGRSRVMGVVDGDGLSRSLLSEKFDAPYQGPLFAWKAYSIENLLAMSGVWPESWGEAPEWG